MKVTNAGMDSGWRRILLGYLFICFVFHSLFNQGFFECFLLNRKPFGGKSGTESQQGNAGMQRLVTLHAKVNKNIAVKIQGLTLRDYDLFTIQTRRIPKGKGLTGVSISRGLPF